MKFDTFSERAHWVVHASGIAGLVVLALGWWMGIHAPGVAKHAALVTEREELENLLRGRSNIAQRCVALERGTEGTQKRLDQARAWIVMEPDVPKMLGGLAALAQRHEVQILDLQPQAVQVTKASGRLPLKCRLQANWEGLCRFLDGLQHGECAVRIEAIALSTGADTELSPATVDLSLLYAPQGSELHRALGTPPKTPAVDPRVSAR